MAKRPFQAAIGSTDSNNPYGRQYRRSLLKTRKGLDHPAQPLPGASILTCPARDSQPFPRSPEPAPRPSFPRLGHLANCSILSLSCIENDHPGSRPKNPQSKRDDSETNDDFLEQSSDSIYKLFQYVRSDADRPLSSRSLMPRCAKAPDAKFHCTRIKYATHGAVTTNAEQQPKAPPFRQIFR
ncbi:hypothetical protein H4684_001081 [Desulfomicrobium macestii]|uniref:Uncharacterized protein n=1 Tax=Desulfomicrobium macestii TaxID=90731 RepID=A0ABR9H173_9BACT|nr:hypothetical protein [Desulfomicrobium macestii]